MSSTPRRVLIAATVALCATVSGPMIRADAENGVRTVGTASERASRTPHAIVEYDVFGDSISAGFGVPAHLTWVGAVSFHLFATQAHGVEHRFYNHAIAGQSIATPSFLASDQRNSSLLAHLRNFVQDPERDTPLAQRRFVITPSVNELVVSDQGPSGRARIDKAINGVRETIRLLSAAGVPGGHIIVLPMPPIGLQFAAAYEASSDVDRTLASMIVLVNAGLADVLDVPGYPTLDANNNGLAVAEFYDDLFDPSSRRGPDGLHLDVDGHEALAADVDHVFRDS